METMHALSIVRLVKKIVPLEDVRKTQTKHYQEVDLSLYGYMKM